MVKLKKVFLNDLSKRGKYIDWKNSIGHKVKFIYNDIEGEVEIINHYRIKNKFLIDIVYKNKIYSMLTSNFSLCQLGEMIKQGKLYKYGISELIKTKTSCIKILEQIRIKNGNQSQKGYKYKCLNCNNEDQISEYDLNNGSGCNVCCISSKKVLKGYNDLWTIHPEVAQLLKDAKKGYILHSNSQKSEIFICPYCKHEKTYKISVVVNFKFSCPRCGDGISYPNKFAFNLLEQLNINYISEHRPDWIKPRRYDFYFELSNKKYIIEMDGKLGHGNDNPLNGQTAEDSKAIDDYKDKLANEHGIEVIRIDCIKSEMDLIRNNILNSKLSQIFDLSIVDWLKCHEFACNNLVKEVSKLWNNKLTNIEQIANMFKLDNSTIRNYLKQGTELKWCDYNPEKEKIIAIRKKGKNAISVIQLTLDGQFIKLWNSIIEASQELNIDNISHCCRNKGYNHAGGYMWMYENDYKENKNKVTPYKNYTKNYKTRKVIQLTDMGLFIKGWNSQAEVKRELNISQSNISQCCQGKRNYVGGFKWMYEEDYDEYINKHSA